MAWKGKTSGTVDYSNLLSTLVNSKIGKDNPALYQTIQGLITGAQSFSSTLKDVFLKTDKLDLKNQVSGLLPGVNGGANPGYYYPTLVIAVNLDTTAAFYCHYIIFANYVIVFGKLTAQATAPNIQTGVDIQLPVVSKFTSADQCHGIANGLPLGASVEGVPGTITGNTVSQMAALRYFPPNTDDMDFRFMFSYQLL